MARTPTPCRACFAREHDHDHDEATGTSVAIVRPEDGATESPRSECDAARVGAPT